MQTQMALRAAQACPTAACCCVGQATTAFTQADAAPRGHSRRRAILWGLGAAVPVPVGLLARDASAAPAPASDVDPSQSAFVKALLARTEENREARRKERLDSYNRRNFGDYLEFSAGAATSDGVLSENDRAIRNWLQANRR